jgi:hypothetical protein
MKRSISERCLFYVMFSEDKDHIFFSCSNSMYVWEKVMLNPVYLKIWLARM